MLPSLCCGRGVFLAPFNVKTLLVFLVKLLSRHELLANQGKTELPCKYSWDSLKGYQALAFLPPRWHNPALIQEITWVKMHREQQTGLLHPGLWACRIYMHFNSCPIREHCRRVALRGFFGFSATNQILNAKIFRVLGGRGLEAFAMTLNWNANIFQFNPCLQLERQSKQTSKQIKAMQRADKRAAERERPKSFPSDDNAGKTSEVGQRDDSVGSASASCSHCVYRWFRRLLCPVVQPDPLSFGGKGDYLAD